MQQKFDVGELLLTQVICNTFFFVEVQKRLG